ncbi:TPA: hypothetical protein DDW35_12000 [Candidatus Sumerlaeota bacterium]|jgi:paraquat-inducible protein B|nr:hypothetical protein [Candidatus Sumerlaeota bacterium]
MLSKANPTVIGAFVIGAIILALSGLLVFGSGSLFKKTNTFVAFFPGAVDGLDIGAPVSFRGVRVGSVRDISLVVNTTNMETYVKVLLAIEQSKAERFGKGIQSGDMYSKLQKSGLKAQLQMQSIVTGRLFVALDLFPNIPESLRGLDARYTELPVAPTDMEELRKTLSQVIDKFQKIPFDKIVNNLDQTLDGINKLVNNENLAESLRGMNSTVKHLDTLVTGLNETVPSIAANIDASTSETRKLLLIVNSEIRPLIANLKKTSDAANASFVQIEKTLSFSEGVPANIAKSLINTSDTAQKTLDQAVHTLGAVEKMSSPDSKVQVEMVETLKELQAAARALRSLSETLDRNPEALLRGKGATKGN